MRPVIFSALIMMSAACGAPAPDTIYKNAIVWTGDGGEAEAFSVLDGRILDVGEVTYVAANANTDTELIDLGGAFVVPGFIDNHTHFLSGGFQLASVELRDADTPEEFTRRIAAFVADVPPGRWILGGDWDHERWGGQLPERSWIDAVTPDNPVFVSRLDGHMALSNSLALELAGIDATTTDPAGGTVVRGAGGLPTGVLKDEAMNLVYRTIPDRSAEEMAEALNRATKHALSMGVTQIHDVGSFGGWNDLATFEAAHTEGNLGLRVYSMVPLSSWQRLAARIEERGRGDDWLRWGGLKGFVDGSLGSTTAWFAEPYEDEPSTSGLIVTDTTALANEILAADAAGLHLAVHAIGDQANGWLLDQFQRAELINGSRARRFRIEHAQHLDKLLIARIADLAVVASMQPYHAIDDGRWAEKRIGPERIQHTYAFRSLLEAGATLTFGSDWTVGPLSPLEGIYAAVTRRTIDAANPDGWIPAQKISVEESLTAYTRSSAWAGWQEDDVGTLASGKLADFVVIDRDLRAIPAPQIRDARVLRTVIGGKTVYEAR